MWEPSKQDIRNYEKNGTRIPREARVEVVLENGDLYWGVVSLSNSKIETWERVREKEGQPAFQVDEHEQIEKMVKSDSRVRYE